MLMTNALRRASVAMLFAMSLSTIAYAQTIRPVFNWPSTATATIIVESQRAPDSAKVTFTRAMEVRPRDGLLVIRQPTTLPPQADSTSTGLRTFSIAIADIAYAVGRDGSFIGLVDTMALHQASELNFEESMQRLRARSENVQPEVTERTIARMRENRSSRPFSVASQIRVRQHSWELLAHAFLGRSWSPGDSQVTVTKEPLPMSTDITTERHLVTRYIGTVACPLGVAGTCWRFTTRSFTSPDSWVAAMRAQFQSMTPAGLPIREPTITPMSAATTTDVIVSSETLLPLRVESRFQAAAVRDRPATDSRSVSTYSWKY